VVAGLSIFTPPLALAPPDWLLWLCAPKDGPILVLLGLVLLGLGLGLVHGRRMRRQPP
jgi:hypothetical protein